MRRLRFVLAACLLAPSVGCESLRDWMNKNRPPRNNGNAGAIPPVGAEQLVGYLNTQAGRLPAISYGNVQVAAREGVMRYPTLNGSLHAAQPRNFRMVATGKLVSAKVDFGSNPDQFWAYVAAPTMQPTYVFASHTDFETGKAQLPGGVPFEPDWVMQALGMTTFPTNLPYTVRTEERERNYVLSWEATTPNKTPIRKEIVFAVDDADAARGQPQVKRHLIRDAKWKIICSAEVRSARTVPVGGTDPQTGRPYVVQYPTEVDLKWEEQKFEMTLRLDPDAVKLNTQLTPKDLERLFTLPNIPGANPVDLAHARFDVPGK